MKSFDQNEVIVGQNYLLHSEMQDLKVVVKSKTSERYNRKIKKKKPTNMKKRVTNKKRRGNNENTFIKFSENLGTHSICMKILH